MKKKLLALVTFVTTVAPVAVKVVSWYKQRRAETLTNIRADRPKDLYYTKSDLDKRD